MFISVKQKQCMCILAQRVCHHFPRILFILLSAGKRRKSTKDYTNATFPQTTALYLCIASIPDALKGFQEKNESITVDDH